MRLSRPLSSGIFSNVTVPSQWESRFQPSTNDASTLGSHSADEFCGRYTVGDYTCICSAGWTGENCAIDIDECASSPCQNGGECIDSAGSGELFTVSYDAYRCQCQPGYANGMCMVVPMAEYEAVCNLTHGGHCDIDIDECVGGPCAHQSACSESSADPDVNVNAFRCICSPGFANGVCDYASIPEYDLQCDVRHGGRCEVDVDECASRPCQHSSACFDSTDGSISGAVPVRSSSATKEMPRSRWIRQG